MLCKFRAVAMPENNKKTIDLSGKSENFFVALLTLRLRVKINECACAFWIKCKAAKLAKRESFFCINYFPENSNVVQ